MAVNLLTPVIPCIFMGTEFFSNVPFTDLPDSIRWKDVSEELSYVFLYLYESRDEYSFKRLSTDLIYLHKLYHIEGSALEIVWENEEKGILAYSLSTSSNKLLIIINVSLQSITFIHFFILIK